jgi:hypothetical protein
MFVTFIFPGVLGHLGLYSVYGRVVWDLCSMEQGPGTTRVPSAMCMESSGGAIVGILASFVRAPVMQV